LPSITTLFSDFFTGTWEKVSYLEIKTKRIKPAIRNLEKKDI